MPGIERPPVSPQVQAQMGPPGGGPEFGAGIAQAQAVADKSPAEVATATCEKILMGVQDEAFRPYAMKAIASLKVGVAMVQHKGPKSGSGAGMMPPPNGGPGGPGVPGPPTPGQMPG
jgi:hypothetical protein